MTLNVRHQDIETIVCDYYNCKKDKLYTKTRKREVSFVRQLIMDLCMRYVRLSSPATAKIYHRDHATALHAKKTIQNIYDTDRIKRSEINEIENLIKKESNIPKIVVKSIDLLEMTIKHTDSYIN